MQKKTGHIIKVIFFLVVLINIGLLSLFVLHEFFHLTSSNTALYVLRGKAGGIEITRDLMFEEADRLVFMLDANGIYNYMMKGIAIAKNKPVLELTWDDEEGRGDVKQFRPDGTMLSFTFSRFKEDVGEPQGLFLGGELPFGDADRSPDSRTSGFGYYDGKTWNHIWCAANEGFTITGTDISIVPPLWKYKGTRVIKNTEDEIILLSDHEANIKDYKIKMKRLVSFKAGDDYFTLKFRISNAGYSILSYGYAYGDEPWIGNFGASEGDVGWVEGGTVQHESLISPLKYAYAGYWDHGNTAIGENTKKYSEMANFIEWVSPTPTAVFFSNKLEDCCEQGKPLDSNNNRILNIVWLNQVLLPGESKDHVLVIGMAKPNPQTGLPEKPLTKVY